MKLKSEFELIRVADEYMIVPVGKEASLFRGIVILNQEAALIAEKLKENCNLDNLISSLIEEFDVEQDTAEKDISQFIIELTNLGVIDR